MGTETEKEERGDMSVEMKMEQRAHGSQGHMRWQKERRIHGYGRNMRKN